jgi:hypothetical protein
MTKKDDKLKYILVELGHHLPYTIFGVCMGLILMGVLNFFAVLLKSEDLMAPASMEFFHISHASHVLFSAVATTAMFWKHEKRIFKALLVGSLGSIGVCSLSDTIFPTIGGSILGVHMKIHVCIFKEPWLIIPFAVVGILAGFIVPDVIEKSTQYSHSVHVLLGSLSSILYLLGFGMHEWVHMLGGVLIITVFSVMVPCCLSGIVFPLMCVHRDCHHPEMANTT